MTTAQDEADLAIRALGNYATIKKLWATTRVEIQHADDALTTDMIGAAMQANNDAGREPLSGDARSLMDLSQALKLARDNLERLWWDKRKQESTI